MANENDYLLDRIERLEALIATLIITDFSDVAPDDLYFLLREFPFRDKPFYKEFRHILKKILYDREKRPSRLRNIDYALNEFRAKIDDNQEKYNMLREEFQKNNFELRNEIKLASEKIETLDNSTGQNKKELHQFLIYTSLGLDLDSLSINRFIPLRVYISKANSNDIEQIQNNFEKFIELFGFNISDEFPAEKGSWWKKWFAKSKETLSKPEVKERLEKVERALELKGLNEPQSQVDKNQADGVSSLIKSLENTPSAVLQVGSILLIKKDTGNNCPCIQVRTLTNEEMIYLEKHQKLLSSPNDILEKLSDFKIDKELGQGNA